MLREIHHRVKNNLQIVNSLLNLQASSIDDPVLKNQLLISQSRVKSMALIHQLLYKSKDLSSIDMEEYLYGLLSYILASYGELQDRITIKIKSKGIIFSIETAVPFGLLVNEFLVHSLKQGLPVGRSGVIDISISQNEDGSFTFIYNDNGIGLPLTVANGHVMTFGMYLMDTLVSQIDGKLELNSEPNPELDRERGGVSYKINFRGSNYQSRFHIS
jgi:two-component sensor histidine kinase